MRPVLRTTNLALVESARVALEFEDIPAVTSNAYAAGLPFNLVTVAILRDADFERAVALVRELQRATVVTDSVYPRQRRSQLLTTLLLVLAALYGLVWLIA